MAEQPLYALIASLPFLRMQEKPAVSYGDFLESAAAFVEGQDLEELTALTLIPAKEQPCFRDGSFAAKYTAWENALRQSILRLRTAKFHLENTASAPRDAQFECDADSVAVRAYAADPLERERILDAARWDKAEELSSGHVFDLDVVEAFAVKLQIAEKWAKRAAGDPAKNLDSAAAMLEQTDGQQK